jgi:hypothetical protein
MGRPPRIPDRGDVAPSVVARRLGLSLEEFERVRPHLERRKFPRADPTTGRYCMEAVDRWRLSRYPELFPELTAAPAARRADAVFDDRLARING